MVRLETRFTHGAEPRHHRTPRRTYANHRRYGQGCVVMELDEYSTRIQFSNQDSWREHQSYVIREVQVDLLGRGFGSPAIGILRVCFRAGSSHYPILLVASREHLEARTCLGNTGKLAPALQVETQLVFPKTKTFSGF